MISRFSAELISTPLVMCIDHSFCKSWLETVEFSSIIRTETKSVESIEFSSETVYDGRIRITLYVRRRE